MSLGVPQSTKESLAAQLPSITVQDHSQLDDTSFYGKFRTIVKQKFFGIKLEEEPFMEFIENNPVRTSNEIFVY